MDLMEIRAIAEKKKQRRLLEAFQFSVVVAGVTAGIFFVWLAIASEMGGFLGTLSVVFGVAIAAASVMFAYLRS